VARGYVSGPRNIAFVRQADTFTAPSLEGQVNMLGFFDRDQARRPVNRHAAQLTHKTARATNQDCMGSAWENYASGGGETLKPKCFSEADHPPHLFASNFLRAFRTDAGEAKTTADFLDAQSLCLCISPISFISGMAQTLCWSKALVTLTTGRS
jgi:hypothetical protein